MWWASVVGLAVVVGLVVVFAVWVVHSLCRARRQARLLAQLAEQYRKARPALPTTGESPPRRTVTVDELVARIEREGLPVRLQWNEGKDGSSGDDWPTGILPRM
jgi:hypothetical protein